MWKKILLACITLAGSISVGYAFVHQMNAATASDIAKLKSGYTVILGTDSSGQEIAWDVHVENTDNYTLSTKIDRVQHCTSTTSNVSQRASNIAYCDFVSTVSGKDDSPSYVSAKKFDDDFYISNQANSFEQSEIMDQSSISEGNLKRAFIPTPAQISDGGILGITTRSDLLGTEANRFVLSKPIYDAQTASYGSGNASPFVRTPFSAPNGTVYSEWTAFNWAYHSGNNPSTGGWAMVDVRPFVQIKKALIVSVLNSDYQKNTLYELANQNNTFKIRYADPSYSIAFNDLKINNSSIVGKKVIKNTTIQIDAVASDTLTVFVFDGAGSNLLYYKALNNNSFDLTGIPAGKYKIAVANEEFNDTTGRPAKSSPISDMKSIEIVDPHKITYTKQPQTGAGAGTDYEFSKNVNAGQIVGNISVNPQGVMPLTYSIETNGDNSYQNFEIDGLNSSSASSSTSLNVKIKSSAPDLVNGGLKAGTYKFCVSAVDANGDPTTATSDSKVCTSFTVEKTNLTVAFDDPTQVKKSAADAAKGWNETATANPSAGTKVAYSKVSGDISLINIDPDTGAITFTGTASDYGKITIQAVADDDPSTGLDNYNASSPVTKEIVIYREVDGSVTPHANSSDANSPTFAANDSNVKINGVIGTIKGSLGTPDTVTSGSMTYTYGLKNTGDGSFFTVNTNTGEIKSNANLGVGTYNITVTVSDKWSTKEIPVTINVGKAPAEDLKFYENSTSNTIINQKSVNFTDTNVSVYASVKGSSNTNPVTYKIQDGSTNVIEVNPNSGAITIRGVGTVVIVAEKAGASGQADAQATLTFTVNAVSQNFIYTTDSTLQTEMPKNGNNYKTYTETYAPSKTFQLYTAGYPSGSTVTYQLKAGSPSDVISVDSNGLVHILNASMNSQKGNVIVQATSHDPSGNYVDKTIELPIDIDKGTRVIAFEKNPITVVNGTGSITPNMLMDGVLDTEGNTMIEIDPSEDHSIAWTNDGETIQYSWNDASGKDIKLHATKSADRNYKEAKAEGTLHILGADEASLTITTPGRIIYGDHFTIRSTQDDSMSTNVQYTFETDNQVFISAPQVNGNKAEFDAIGNSGSTEITIKVTRTADGELPLTKSVKIKVLPKPITIEIEDKTKKRLEENPTLTIKDISHELVVWNGVKDNVDTSVIKLSTTAGKYSPIGSYPITSKNYTTLNDNYPNYIFTIKEGLLNVIDNGNKDFWDVDDDGCPDLNIQIKDEEGNVITINGDVNEDGIPDYNIDSNGDGKPDLNIDTDHDGKPDLNLVILKEWKPSKCVTLGDIQYSSGITAKPEINMDVDGDLIPDINIDTDGDFKADYNIDSDGDGKANVNIGPMHSQWKPDHDYKYQGFAYDTIGKAEPLLNIDTDGDGRPDLNLDLDDDGVADLNIDVDGDWIPDVNIDSNGDGKPDLNLDPDEDGNPTKNVIKLETWKPDHNVEKPFAYDTMKIENKKELEDGGIKIEKGDGSTFPASMALKVIDVTAEKKEAVRGNAADFIKEGQEVKQVFEINLLENGIEVKPDGILKIRIPIADDIKNPTLIRQKEDGSYEKINAIIEDGYLVYESDELGIVSIIGDRSSEIQGSYYPGDNVGGALTGDHTNIMMYISMGCVSLGMICLILFKQKQERQD